MSGLRRSQQQRIRVREAALLRLPRVTWAVAAVAAAAVGVASAGVAASAPGRSGTPSAPPTQAPPGPVANQPGIGAGANPSNDQGLQPPPAAPAPAVRPAPPVAVSGGS